MGGKSDNSAPQPYNGPQMDPNFLQNQQQAPAFVMPEFHMPDYSGQQADYQAQLQKQQAEAARTAGENDRDTLYSDYMSAAGSATDYINQQITQEQSNAALLGIDYQLDDAAKATRISDYFASIWGEGDQTRLQGLFDKWGNPEGFEDWTLERGDAGNVPGGTEGSEESVAGSKGRKPTLATGIDTADTTLGATTLLGG